MQRRDYISVNFSAEVIPSRSRHSPAMALLAIAPPPPNPTPTPPQCEHLFQTEWEREHPSAGLLRIFMTGWCHSGCSLAGILLGSPRRRKTLMTHQVSWLEAVTEINRRGGGGMQITSRCLNLKHTHTQAHAPQYEQEVESDALKVSRCVMWEYRSSGVGLQNVSFT